MKELWPHLVKAGLSVLTIAVGTYIGFVMYDNFGNWNSNVTEFTGPSADGAFSSYLTQ